MEDDYLLLENGGFLLLEDGGLIILSLNGVQIFVNDVDRSNDIAWESINFRQNLTKSPSTVSFSIKEIPGRSMPTFGDEVVVYEDEVTLFRGIVTERSERVVSGLMVGFDYVCKDKTQVLDRRLIAKAYSNVQAHEVVEDIIDNYTTGFTFVPPASSPEIDTIRFNYEQPSKALQIICQAIGYDWYIDMDDVIQFFPRGDFDAPFQITDENGMAYWNSLEFDRNIIELKNSVFVRGGTFIDNIIEADARDVEVSDGEKIQYLHGLQYSNLQVTVDGTPQTVGVDFINDPADFDCLYNFQEKFIRFREDNKPADGEVVRSFGDAHIPLIVQAEDPTSIDTYGRYEGVRIDKTINSIAEAEMLANTLLAEWRIGSYAGKFRTSSKGLRTGQTIVINVPSRGVNEEFLINQIVGKISGDRFEYTVYFIKSGQVTFTDIMVGLLERQNKDIVIADNEVVQRITSLFDSVALIDEIVSITSGSPPYTYEGGANDTEWDLATWA